MPDFHYKARNKKGEPVQGVMEADSESAVAGKLEQMECVPLSISRAGTKGTPRLRRPAWRLGRVRLSDINMFTRQLFTLQRAGLPIINSLRALEQQVESPELKQAIGYIIRDIEAGSDLADAFERHPAIFNSLYVNMIRAGEVSGKLPEILDRLATLGEYEDRMNMKVKMALRYPMLVVTAMVIAFLILITVVVPRFQQIYSAAMKDLPLPTLILIWINKAVTQYWWLILAAIAALYFFIRQYIRTAKGSWWFDQLRLKVPVFGPLTLKIAMSRFGRITGMLLKSGVPILQILDLVKEGLGNAVVAETIDRIKTNVNDGRGMLDPIKKSGLFPPIVVQMIAVGEETGNMDELLTYVSEYYDYQIDYTVNNLVSLIEPFLILILGSFVLLMALGIFLPMWSMMEIFKR